MRLSGAYRQSTGVRVVVNGARGMSDYQVWRLQGNAGSYLDYLNYLAGIVIANRPGFKGDKGDPGANVMAIGLFNDASGLNIPNGTNAVRTSGFSAAGLGIADYAFDAAVDAAYVAANPYSSFRSNNGRGFRLASRTGFMDATIFGVKGDGVADDTPRAQAFINYCQSIQKTAYFGALKCKISGPLKAVNTGVVFDQWSYGGDGPGFYVTGAGYTALTVLGAVADFCCTVYGSGNFTVDGNGNVTSDTRPAVNGIRFGSIAENTALLASIVRNARVYQLNGFGISCFSWDTTFLALSAELCGNADNYAFICDGNNDGYTTNECNFVRIQVEQSLNKSSYISPATLSCTFGKVHTERAFGRDNEDTWIFGPGVWQSVRASAINGRGRATIVAQSATFYSYRPEGIATLMSTNGGYVDMYGCEGGVYGPAAGSNGRVNFYGGFVEKALNLPNDWLLHGCRISQVTVGYTPPGTSSTLRDCAVASLSPADGNSYLDVHGCDIASLAGGGWGQLRLLNHTEATLAGGAQGFGYGKLWLDEHSVLIGNLTFDNVGARINGRVQGGISIMGARQVLYGETAEVTGNVVNNGPPESGAYLDGLVEGMATKNIRPGVVGVAGSQYMVGGWRYAGGAWRERRELVGT